MLTGLVNNSNTEDCFQIEDAIRIIIDAVWVFFSGALPAMTLLTIVTLVIFKILDDIRGIESENSTKKFIGAMIAQSILVSVTIIIASVSDSIFKEHGILHNIIATGTSPKTSNADAWICVSVLAFLTCILIEMIKLMAGWLKISLKRMLWFIIPQAAWMYAYGFVLVPLSSKACSSSSMEIAFCEFLKILRSMFNYGLFVIQILFHYFIVDKKRRRFCLSDQ